MATVLLPHGINRFILLQVFGLEGMFRRRRDREAPSS